MSEVDQNIVESVTSGTKRRPRHEDHPSFDEPASKTRRRSDEYDYMGQQHADNPKSNSDGTSRDGSSDNKEDVWNEEQHKDFVSSIFEIGLKHASPAIILENMTQKVETITSERVKSKLQKYRSSKNKAKSKQEFMEDYCEFLQKIKSMQAAARPGDSLHDLGGDPILSKLLRGDNGTGTGKTNLLLSGDAAGYLTYCVMKETAQTQTAQGPASPNGTTSSAVLPTNVLRKGAREYVDNYAGCAMQFPILTEIEKKSSLGIAMTFIAGLFLTMSQHLTRERARAETIGLKLCSATTTTTTTSTTTSTSIDTIHASENDTGRTNS